MKEQADWDAAIEMLKKKVSYLEVSVKLKSEELIWALGEREYRKAHPPVQINNISLPTGSPLYFYCHACGHLAEEKPEDYTTAVKTHCALCQELEGIENGIYHRG